MSAPNLLDLLRPWIKERYRSVPELNIAAKGMLITFNINGVNSIGGIWKDDRVLVAIFPTMVILSEVPPTMGWAEKPIYAADPLFFRKIRLHLSRFIIICLCEICESQEF